MSAHEQHAVPNLYWHSISCSTLRSFPRFVALPPVSQVCVRDYHSCSRIRQHSRAWSALHRGVLTTGYIKEALGFKEPRAAQVLGAHNQAGHGALRGAVSHLKQPHSALLQQVTALQAAAGTQCQQPSQADHARQQDGTSSCQDKEQTINALNNNGSSSDGSSSSMQPCTGSQNSVVPQLAASLADCVLDGTSSVAAATTSAVGSEAAPAWCQWLPGGSSNGTHGQQAANPGTSSRSSTTGSSHKRRRRRKGKGTCHSSGNNGNSMPSASYAADQALGHPGANHTSSRPTMSAAALSDVGISLAAAGYGASSDEEDELSDGSGCLAHCQVVAAGGLTSVCCAWGTVQEAAAVYQLLLAFPDAVGEEAGLHLLPPDTLPATWGATSSNLPLLGATPDAFLCHALPVRVQLTQQQQECIHAALAAIAARDAAVAAAAVLQLGSMLEQQQPGSCNPTQQQQQQQQQLEELGTGAAWQHLLQLLQVQLPGTASGSGQQPHAATASTDSSSSSSSGVTPGAAITAAVRELVPGGQNAALVKRGHLLYLFVREVVEVKNHCPFQVGQLPPSRKGRPRTKYVVNDRGPRQRLLPMWVPQLQLHMASSGCHSALLVSRSATRGIHVFRVYADELYQRRMLAYASRTYTSYVLTSRQVAPDSFCHEPAYQLLLQHTRAVAAHAVLLDLPREPQAAGMEGALDSSAAAVGAGDGSSTAGVHTTRPFLSPAGAARR